MQYDVTRLRLAVRDALANDLEACQNAWQARVDQYEYERKAWLEANAERWAKAATVIRAKVRKGQPISSRDFPPVKDGWSHHRADTFEAQRPGDFRYVVPTDLAVVRTALEIVKDDTVTATELQRLGVKGSTLRTVFELAHKDGEKP